MCMAFSGPGINYHTDAEAARKLGFPDIVVQGMWSVCLVAEMMTQRFGLGFMTGGKLDLRLVNVLWVDEVSGTHGRIIERRPEGKRTRAVVEVWCGEGRRHQDYRRHGERARVVAGTHTRGSPNKEGPH